MTKTITAKELLEMGAPLMETDPPRDVAEYLNACIMSDIMSVVGMKLTKQEIHKIEQRINERFLDDMIRFLGRLERLNEINLHDAIKHLLEVKNEIQNSH